MDPLLSRITIDQAICHGKPCVRGLRYPVETVLELLSSGMTHDEILADFEDLERDDLLAVLAYAARLARTCRVTPIEPDGNELRPEYNFRALGGVVRGKYAARYRERLRVVRLAADVAGSFADEDAVNAALREYLRGRSPDAAPA